MSGADVRGVGNALLIEEGVLMDMRREDGPRRVQFVLALAAGLELNGVRLPAVGVFLDQNGEVIKIAVDDTDPFRQMTKGMFFSKMEAKQALHGSRLRSMTTNAQRRAIFGDIASSGLACFQRDPLRQALADFRRPMWGICDDHLHIYLRGEVLCPVDASDAARSLMGGSFLTARLMDEGFFDLDASERLLTDLSDPRFEELPLTDPPRRRMRITIVLVG